MSPSTSVQETDQVTVRRQNTFTVLEDAVFQDRELGKEHLLVYWTLAYHADRHGKNCWPSLATIAQEARCSRSKVIEVIDDLIWLGYVEKEARFKLSGDRTSNAYILTGKRETSMEGGGSPPRRLPWSPPETTGSPPRGQELDSSEPNTLREEGADYATAPGGPSPAAEAPAAAPPLSLLEQVKEEAVRRGKGTGWILNGWTARFARLLQEVRQIDVLPAFRACLDAGGNPYYFPADFAKWAGKATATTAVSAAPALPPRDVPARCPDCGQPMMRAEDGWACLRCHERFDRALHREQLITADQVHRVFHPPAPEAAARAAEAFAAGAVGAAGDAPGLAGYALAQPGEGRGGAFSARPYWPELGMAVTNAGPRPALPGLFLGTPAGGVRTC